MNLITAESLTRAFQSTVAVDGINLSIKEGVCTALLGPNGAGKTTTLNMLTGLIKPTGGSIAFDERYHGDRRQYIGYLPQFPKFYGWMSGQEYLMYTGQLCGLTKKAANERAEELLTLVDLAEAKRKRIGGYSGGMKQRLGIAQALVNNPKLVILDEPVSALDPIGRREVLELMKKLKKTTSILFSTHVLHDAEEVSDDIFIMNRGKVVIEGGLAELQTKYQKPTIYIETEEEPDIWCRALKKKEWFRHMHLDKKQLTITVENINTAREELLADATLHKLKPLRFEVVRTTLEDLFMEVAKK
ncbi:ABC-2 type transport system ATP-binding protein [Evansella caseinilytica]|uniref:ABC-2 type transport system ATP-binding protein n=1 Tax=Evansella caseinilytica TaxID=1503961 RepID=A0A1H3TG90_9BACI|nr:ABC transporter ATP-binding protein [Evansella caseinilytica]SDZ49246.1 ABC-2 type transport system ATP-binding protein [Evansella caseinilytica]